MRESLVSADGQTCVEHEYAALGPWCEQTTFVRRRLEAGVVLLESDVHVSEGRRGDGRTSNGEGKAVGLIDVVVRVLTEDDDFDIGERGVV